MAHSNVVINCIGREWPTRNFSLEEVNIHGPARLARIARESGVKRFVHISAINAREQPKVGLVPEPVNSWEAIAVGASAGYQLSWGREFDPTL
jgi:nucleoside-diphosphate-sugar epimerase